MNQAMARWLFLAFLFVPSLAAADCYSWPLRTVDGRQNYDADTLYIAMPGLPPALADMSVRALGVDAPEIRGKCESERAKAAEAREFVTAKLAGAASVTFCNIKWDKYGGRILADVRIDGENLADILIQRRLARSYDGKKRGGWCN